MRKTFVDNSLFIETISELAEQRIKEKFGDSGYIIDENESRYTEEAQDYFNEIYDEIEFTLNKTLNVHSSEDNIKILNKV